MNRVLKCVGCTVLAVGAIAALTAVVMWLWNCIVPGVIGWGTITYWQALGLFALCKLLFGGFGHGRGCGCHGHGHYHHHHGHRFHEKWAQMTPEEREEFVKRRHAHHFGHGGCCESKNED